MSLFKYFGEQGDDGQHGGRLFWSGALGGLPYRGQNAPILNKDELTEQIEIHWDFKLAEFDISDANRRKEYQYVMDRIINGWFFLHHREHIKDTETGRVRYIYLEWSQRYGELSPTASLELKGRSND